MKALGSGDRPKIARLEKTHNTLVKQFYQHMHNTLVKQFCQHTLRVRPSTVYPVLNTEVNRLFFLFFGNHGTVVEIKRSSVPNSSQRAMRLQRKVNLTEGSKRAL